MKVLINPEVNQTSIKSSLLKRQNGGFTVYPYVGEKLSGAKYYTFLMIGDENSGKNTLLDGIVNRVCDVQCHYNWRYKLSDDGPQETAKQTKNKVQSLKTYYINDPANKFNIKIIDVPGLSANKSKLELRNQLYKIFKIKDKIHYILFVNKASDVKLNEQSAYIYEELQNIFSKNVSQRFLLMYTDASKGFVPKSLSGLTFSNFPYKKYFCFNNAKLFNSVSEKLKQREDEWNFGMSCINYFIKYVLKENKPPISLFGLNQQMDGNECFQNAPAKFLYNSFKEASNELKQKLTQTKHTLQQLRRIEQTITENVEQVRQTKLTKKVEGFLQMSSICNVTCCEICRWPDDEQMSKIINVKITKNDNQAKPSAELIPRSNKMKTEYMGQLQKTQKFIRIVVRQ